jgi:wyosine [tRNA(Phe)-imidazoG37] synthetase (radical SAM superfamily)
MSGFLFHEVVFGPVRSRRLGLSLGLNLLPSHFKQCTFNCIYCECGWTRTNHDQLVEYPTRAIIHHFLEKRLKELAEERYLPDALTFAGNGEPTMNPDFAGIVDETILLRDKYAPDARVAVLSNSSRISDPKVFQALLRIDDNILKLDAGSERIFRLMNNPVQPVKFSDMIDDLRRFNGKVIIQSMFLRGAFLGEQIDNTTDDEVNIWLDHLVAIQPEMVMIYPIARAPPVHNLEKIPIAELEKIALKVRETGLKVKVYN